MKINEHINAINVEWLQAGDLVVFADDEVMWACYEDEIDFAIKVMLEDHELYGIGLLKTCLSNEKITEGDELFHYRVAFLEQSFVHLCPHDHVVFVFVLHP